MKFLALIITVISLCNCSHNIPHENMFGNEIIAHVPQHDHTQFALLKLHLDRAGGSETASILYENCEENAGKLYPLVSWVSTYQFYRVLLKENKWNSFQSNPNEFLKKFTLDRDDHDEIFEDSIYQEKVQDIVDDNC